MTLHLLQNKNILFCSVLFCSVLFCSVLFCSVLFCSCKYCEYNDERQLEKTRTEIIAQIFYEYQDARICIVSAADEHIVVNNQIYKCYNSISSALSKEYKSSDALLILILEGIYLEHIRLYTEENVIFYGIDKEKCIIKNDLYDGYYHPPLWIRPSTTVKNLTIFCEKNGAIPSQGAYCIHTDDSGEGKVLIENCNLYSEQGACIGFGTRENAPLYISNCIMKSINSNVLYGHNGHIWASNHEELHVSGCYGISETMRALEIFDANHFYPNGTQDAGDFCLYFNDNTFINSDGTYPSCLSVSFKQETEDERNYFSEYCRRMPTNDGNAGNFLNYFK